MFPNPTTTSRQGQYLDWVKPEHRRAAADVFRRALRSRPMTSKAAVIFACQIATIETRRADASGEHIRTHLSIASAIRCGFREAVAHAEAMMGENRQLELFRL